MCFANVAFPSVASTEHLLASPPIAFSVSLSFTKFNTPYNLVHVECVLQSIYFMYKKNSEGHLYGSMQLDLLLKGKCYSNSCMYHIFFNIFI